MLQFLLFFYSVILKKKNNVKICILVFIINERMSTYNIAYFYKYMYFYFIFIIINYYYK